MRRIGLFGGSFDPPHRAHVALAHAALDALALEAVWWVVTGQPWQKARTVTAGEHRAAMVELAIAGEPRFRLERFELDRAGPSYTIDTVAALSAREATREATREPTGGRPEWVLLIGHDQYLNLHTWRGWRELLAEVTLAVANRPAVHGGPAPEVAALPHRVVPLPMMDISATEVRARVAAGRDISALVPAEVAGYIARHGLYLPPTPAALTGAADPRS